MKLKKVLASIAAFLIVHVQFVTLLHAESLSGGEKLKYPGYIEAIFNGKNPLESLRSDLMEVEENQLLEHVAYVLNLALAKSINDSDYERLEAVKGVIREVLEVRLNNLFDVEANCPSYSSSTNEKLDDLLYTFNKEAVARNYDNLNVVADKIIAAIEETVGDHEANTKALCSLIHNVSQIPNLNKNREDSASVFLAYFHILVPKLAAYEMNTIHESSGEKLAQNLSFLLAIGGLSIFIVAYIVGFIMKGYGVIFLFGLWGCFILELSASFLLLYPEITHKMERTDKALYKLSEVYKKVNAQLNKDFLQSKASE